MSKAAEPAAAAGRTSPTIPPRAGKKRARPGPTRRRRNRLIAVAAVGAVVAIVGVLVGVYAAGGATSSGAPRQPAPAAAVANLTSVPINTLVSASHQVSDIAGATPLSDQALTANGRPQVLYIGAEFCPVCAAERWALVVALSQFGTFSNLQETHSAVRDGNIPTISFYGSTYSSPYLTFTPVETTTNQPQGSYYKSLETPTAAQQALWTAKDGTQLSFPFLDIGGRWLLRTSQYNGQALAGHTFSQIASAVGSNDSTIGAEIDAAAAVMTKYIASITNGQPANVYQAVSGVTLPPPPAG